MLIQQWPGPSSRCEQASGFLCLEFATLLSLRERLPAGGFEPLTIGSMLKNLATELL